MASSCITPQELIDFKHNGCKLSEQLCCPFEDIDPAICEAVEFIEQITCTQWCPTVECRNFSGQGDCKLYFHSQILQTLESVTFNTCGCFLKSEPCTCSGNTNQSVTLIDLPENCTYFLEFKCGENYFPCGKSTVQVCGTWGRPMPLSVKRAIVLYAFEILQPGITGSATNPEGVEQVQWDDFTITYNGKYDTTVLTRFPEINKLIDPFIPMSSQFDIMALDKSCSNCKSKGGCSCH